MYFLGSTDYGLNVGWLDMSSYERPSKSAIYLAVLPADEPSPLLPESDDEVVKVEKAESDKKEENTDEKKKEKKEVAVKINFDRIDQRIITLNVPAGEYYALTAGEKGTIYYLESGKKNKLHRYSLKDREAKEALTDLKSYCLSADGKKILFSKGRETWFIADAKKQIKPEDGQLKTGDMQKKLNPPEEWAQIFREAWRYQRDYFYVENVHGLDLDWAYKTYSPWLKHVRHRADLTYILDILGGETAIGHSFTGGGDWPDVKRVPVGLLGADFTIENNRYRSKQFTPVKTGIPICALR